MKKQNTLIPASETEALQRLCPLLDLDSAAMQGVDGETFKRAWYSIAFLYAGLHPDNALDHGEKVMDDAPDYAPVSQTEPRLIAPYFEQSGWPVVLAPVAKDAWRRFDAGAMENDEFYCVEAQTAGMRFREQTHLRRVV